MQYLETITIAFAPGLFWLWYLRHKDDLEPEPRHKVLIVFVLGCLSTGIVLALRPPLELLLPEEGYARAIADSFYLTAPLEEFAKAAALIAGICWHRELDEPLDGIIYGTAAGLGFASVENVYFLMSHGDWSLVVARGFTATLTHVATSGTFGFFLGMARFSRAKYRLPIVLFGAITAIAFHGAYDLFLFAGGAQSLVALLVVLPLMLTALGLKIRWARARSGYYHPTDSLPLTEA